MTKIIFSLVTLFSLFVFASPKVGELAPTFTAKTHEGKDFDFQTRMGQWTVLYFYPKANTPGCTKQACAFRDNLEKIKSQGADVIGISADTVEDQAKFHKEHNLNFTLLADPEDVVIKMYGAKMPIVKMSKRWTFIIDPELKVRAVMKDVDPVIDSEKIAGQILTLKTKK